MSQHTITIPTADQQKIDTVNAKARVGASEVIDVAKQYAIVLVKLADSTTPSDYASLEAKLLEHSKVDGASLLIDMPAPLSSVPSDHDLTMNIIGNITITPTP